MLNVPSVNPQNMQQEAVVPNQWNRKFGSWDAGEGG